MLFLFAQNASLFHSTPLLHSVDHHMLGNSNQPSNTTKSLHPFTRPLLPRSFFQVWLVVVFMSSAYDVWAGDSTSTDSSVPEPIRSAPEPIPSAPEHVCSAPAVASASSHLESSAPSQEEVKFHSPYSTDDHPSEKDTVKACILRLNTDCDKA